MAEEGTKEKTLDSSTDTKSADVVFAETMEILPKEDESLTTETTTKSIVIQPESSPVSLDIDISIPKNETEVSRLETTVVQEVVDTEEIIEEQVDKEEDVPSTETFKQTVEILPESHSVDDITQEIPPEKTEEETSNVEVPAPEEEIITEERETIDKKPQEISSVDTITITKEGTEEKTLDSSTNTKSADVVFAETMEILPKEDESLTTETTTNSIDILPESSPVSLDIDISIPKSETEVSRLETTVVQEVVDTEEIIEEQEDQEEDVPSTETFKQTVEILPESHPVDDVTPETALEISLEKTEEETSNVEVPAPEKEIITEERETIDKKPQEISSVDTSDIAKEGTEEKTLDSSTDTKSADVDFAETMEILPKEDESLTTETATKSIDIQPESSPVSLDIDIAIPKNETEVSRLETTTVEILPESHPVDDVTQKTALVISLEKTEEETSNVEVPAPEEEIIIEERETIDKKPQEISSVDTITITKEGTEERTLDSSTNTKSADVVFAETMEILPKEDESLTTETTTKSIDILPESSPVSLDIDISIPKSETEVSRHETTVVQEVVDTEEIIEDQVDKEEDIPSTETFKQAVEILPESHPVDDVTQETALVIPLEKTEEETSNVEIPAPEEEIITEERETIDKKPQEISSVDTIDIAKEGTEEKTLDSSTDTKSADVVFAETMKILPKEDESSTTETTTKKEEIITEERETIDKKPQEISSVDTITITKEGTEEKTLDSSTDTKSADVVFAETMEILPKEDESLTTETTTKDIVIQPETSQVSLDIDISIPKDETEVSRLETTVVQEVVDTEEIIEEQEDQEEDVPSTETYKETVEILPEKPSIETSVDDILQNTLEKAETTEKEIEAPLVVEVIEERQQIKETSISDQNLFVSEMFAPNEELISEEKEAVQEIPEKVCTHIEVSQVAIQPSDEGFETVERLTEIDANKPDIKILPENKEELSTTEKLIFDTKESTTELEEENIKDIELDIEVQAPMQDVNEQTYETLALNEKKKTFTNEEIFDEISAGEIKPALEDSLEISSVDNIPSGEVSYKSPTLNSDEQLLLAETPEDMKFSSEETTAISCEQQESIMPVSVKEKQESITSEHFVEKPIEEGVKEVKEDIKDVVREDKAPVPSDKVLVSQQKESVSYPNETEVSELEVEDITQILPKESKAEVMPDVKSVASIGKQEMEITELVLKSREETYEEESWEVEEEKVEELVETNPEEQIVMNAETSTQTIESKIDIMESVDTLDSITIQTFAENFSKDVIKTVLMQETEISKITSEEAPQDVLESDVQESKPTHVSGSSVIPENLAEVLPQYDEETTVVSTVQQNIETPLFEENLPFDSVQNKEESGEVKMAEQLTDATEATEMPISEISLPCDSVDVIKEIKQEDIAQSNEIKISEENVTADDKKEMQSVPIKNEETLETVEITDAETEITAIADKVEQKLVTPVLEITADLDTYEMIEEEHLTAQESFVGTHEDEKTSESSKDESHVKSCKSHLIHLCLKI
uniref:Uncharacterized protein n=1 Tax=Magallana gigas TaxID=29159 RepID=A0A8W8KLQ9_MAGGI